MSEPSESSGSHAGFAEAAGLYLYSRVAAMLVTLVAVVLAPRLYGADGYAFFAALVLLYDSALALGSLGLADAVFYFVGRDRSRAAVIVRQTSGLLAMAAIPVTGVVALVAWALSKPGLDLVGAMGWLALVLMIELPTQPAVNQMLAGGKPRVASLLFVGFSVLRTIAVLLPALVPGLELADIPRCMAAAAVIRGLVYVALVRREHPMPAGARWFVRDELAAILRFAVPAGLAAMCGRLSQQIDKYVVLWLVGKDAFAQITVASWELPLVTLIPYAIGAVMQVRYVELFAQGRVDELRALWHATVAKVTLAVLPLAMLVIAISDDLVIAVFGREFAAASIPFQIFTLILLTRVAAYGPMLQATGQTRTLLVNSLLLLGSNALLSVPLTLAVGPYGAPLATLAASMFTWWFALDRIGRAFGGGAGTALPWGHYLRVLGLSAAIAATVVLLRKFADVGPGLGAAVGAIVYLALYVPIGRATGLIRREELAFVSRWLSLRSLR